MCNFEAARKICILRGLDADLKSSEQLFNRQFLSLSNNQSDSNCAKNDVNGQSIGRWPEEAKLWTTLARPAARAKLKEDD